MDDLRLLWRYTYEEDTRAFDQLVERHYGLVRRASFARTRDSQLADDVANAVFIMLAQRARSIGPNVVLTGWLFKAAHLMAGHAMRDEGLRKKREAEAANMAQAEAGVHSDQADIETIALIDNGLMKLSEQDRNAILLRHAQGLSIKETAKILNITPEAAKKRTLRGLERLRRYCAHHGAALTITAIAASLGEAAIDTSAASAAVLTVGQAIHLESGSILHLIVKGAVKQMILMQIKTAAAVVMATAVVGTSGYTAVRALSQKAQAHTSLVVHTVTMSQSLHPGKNAAFGKSHNVRIRVRTTVVAQADHPEAAHQLKPIDAKTISFAPNAQSAPQGTYSINLSGVPVRQALDILFHQAGLRFTMDDTITGNVSFSLQNVSFDVALKTILRTHNPELGYLKNDNTGVIHIETKAAADAEQVPVLNPATGIYNIKTQAAAGINRTPKPVAIKDWPKQNIGEVALDNVTIDQAVNVMFQEARLNYAIDQTLTGNVTIHLRNVPLELAMKMIERGSDPTFVVVKYPDEDVYFVKPKTPTIIPNAPVAEYHAMASPIPQSLNFKNESIRTALNILFKSAGKNYLMDARVIGTVTLDLTGVPFDQALPKILNANNPQLMATEDRDNGFYFIKPKPQ